MDKNRKGGWFFMRIIYVGRKYDSKIYVDDNLKLIYKLDCGCRDFQFRRIKKVGDNVDVKYFDEPCKHLKKPVNTLIQMGYKLKRPKEMEGSDHLTEKLKKELLKRANYKCKCGSKENLEIHRKIRGSNGGKYNMENCVVLCSDCHKKIHQGEFNGSS